MIHNETAFCGSGTLIGFLSTQPNENTGKIMDCRCQWDGTIIDYSFCGALYNEQRQGGHTYGVPHMQVGPIFRERPR